MVQIITLLTNSHIYACTLERYLVGIRHGRQEGTWFPFTTAANKSYHIKGRAKHTGPVAKTLPAN